MVLLSLYCCSFSAAGAPVLEKDLFVAEMFSLKFVVRKHED